MVLTPYPVRCPTCGAPPGWPCASVHFDHPTLTVQQRQRLLVDTHEARRS